MAAMKRAPALCLLIILLAFYLLVSSSAVPHSRPFVSVACRTSKDAHGRDWADAIGEKQHSRAKDGNEEVCAGKCRIRNLREDGLRDSGLWSPRAQQPPQATGLEMSGITYSQRSL
ncbi:uncharacterized protein LOC120660638 isoform X1 [Panicum virgatum]|uniref:uncharacterized protein LOC120660638 isoform X1 n=1 Tax=Panicum virgatum TaxID=38727 RepID=UPI0019D597CA|nr:uncharacterized protein LOC120660638 isoform X1 [Panicum virgatum]